MYIRLPWRLIECNMVLEVKEAANRHILMNKYFFLFINNQKFKSEWSHSSLTKSQSRLLFDGQSNARFTIRSKLNFNIRIIAGNICYYVFWVKKYIVICILNTSNKLFQMLLRSILFSSALRRTQACQYIYYVYIWATYLFIGSLKAPYTCTML